MGFEFGSFKVFCGGGIWGGGWSCVLIVFRWLKFKCSLFLVGEICVLWFFFFCVLGLIVFFRVGLGVGLFLVIFLVLLGKFWKGC